MEITNIQPKKKRTLWITIMCYRGGLYIGSNVRKNKNVLTLEWMSEMNERKYACQSVVEINNWKFKNISTFHLLIKQCH